MRDATSFIMCNTCLTEFKVEEEPRYEKLSDMGHDSPKEVMFCPFCGSDNIEPDE